MSLAETIYQKSLDLPDEKAIEVIDFIDFLKSRLLTFKRESTNPLDIKNRLEELAKLQDGWLDGKGFAPNHENLLWFGKAFDERFNPVLPLPYLYPTAEGGIQAEWSLADWQVSLEINLDSKSAQWQAFNLVTEECREQDWNLGHAECWQALNQALQALLPVENA